MLRRLFSGAVCLLVVFGCSPPNIAVNTDYDRTVDFSEFKTYGWAPMDEEARARSQVDARIRQVVKNQLESKGVMEVEEDPDMVLVYGGAMQDVEFILDDQGWSWWGGWGGTQNVQTFKKGELRLNMMDPDEKHIIWEGVAQTQGDEEPTLEQIGSAVSKMLSEFPPQSDSGQ